MRWEETLKLEEKKRQRRADNVEKDRGAGAGFIKPIPRLSILTYV